MLNSQLTEPNGSGEAIILRKQINTHLPRRRVVMVLANIKQYREIFYTQLAENLLEYQIELIVAHSEPSREDAMKGDNILLPAPLGHLCPRVYLGANGPLLQWLPLHYIFGADLLIVVQATSYLLNYPLLALAKLGLIKLAFWGHGWNHQGNADSLAERIKRRLAAAPHWWFAYNQPIANYLERLGMDRQRITVVENAIDTKRLRIDVQQCADAHIATMRQRLGITVENKLAIYCGALYREKRLDFLLQMATAAQRLLPSFKLLILGNGPSAHIVSEFAAQHDYIVYPGAMFAADKACCFRLAEVLVNPGAVGLGVLDGFAAGLPLVTSADAQHGPEFAYLLHDINGLVIKGDSQDFAKAVVQLMANPVECRRLAQGALAAGEHYTLENMLQNVQRGILQNFALEPT